MELKTKIIPLNLQKFKPSVWGPENAEELTEYQYWLSKHPHCGTPRKPGPDGPKPNQIKDEDNPELFYIDYSNDQPKNHNFVPSKLGIQGNIVEVTNTFEKYELNRKINKKLKNKLQRWDDFSADQFIAKFHVPDSGIVNDTYERSTVDDGNTLGLPNNSPQTVDDWPKLTKMLEKVPRTKVSPWIPHYEGTEFTRDGKMLDGFKEKELFRNIDKCLRQYVKRSEMKSRLKEQESGSTGIIDGKESILDERIHVEVSTNISDGILKLKNKIVAKNYWNDKIEAIGEDLSKYTSLELEEACFRGNVVGVQMLLLAGKNPTNVDDIEPLFNRMFEKALQLDMQTESLYIGSEETPARKNIQKIIHLLMKYGADVNAMSEVSRLAPIHRAALTGNVKMLLWLVDHHGDMSLKSKKDLLTASQYAARQGHVFILAEAVKAAGMSVVLDADTRGRNALHIACLYDQTDTALFLLGIGVDKRIEDEDGYSAGRLAQRAGFSQTGLAVLGFTLPDPKVQNILQYITDEHNRNLEESEQFVAHDEDDGMDDGDSFASALLNMQQGSTSTMQHIMSYLYRSLNLTSGKFSVKSVLRSGKVLMSSKIR